MSGALHSGIGLHTPASVHHGTAGQIRALRQQTLDAAYQAHPDRFGHRRPRPPKLPTQAWINQPSREALILSAKNPAVSTDLTGSGAILAFVRPDSSRP